jgi:hypothetical protein
VETNIQFLNLYGESWPKFDQVSQKKKKSTDPSDVGTHWNTPIFVNIAVLMLLLSLCVKRGSLYTHKESKSTKI